MLKLRSYGISGNVLDLVKDYISNRRQIVLLNHVVIKAGVPLGSVLVPLLFLLLYISDFTDNLHSIARQMTPLFRILVAFETIQTDVNSDMIS